MLKLLYTVKVTGKLPPVKLAPGRLPPPQQILPWVSVMVWVRVRVGGNLPGAIFQGGNFPSTPCQSRYTYPCVVKHSINSGPLETPAMELYTNISSLYLKR